MPKDGEDKVLAAGRFLRLKTAGGWEYVERANASGVVAILAMTDERKVLLVEQFRRPLGRRVIELPAGLVGDSTVGEEEAEAARRELLEETGYRAGRMERVFEGPSSAGLSNEMITFYVARDLVREGPAAGDGDEEIVLHEVAVEGVRAWLEERGVLVDYKIYVALWLAGER